MAVTPYSEVIGYVRAITGDFGVVDAQDNIVPGSFDKTDANISDIITLALLKYPSYSPTGSDEITPELANDSDKGSVAYYTALLCVLPEGEFTLQAPNMRYRIKENENLIANILGELKTFNDAGASMPSTWGVWDKALNEGQLVANRIRSAEGAI